MLYLQIESPKSSVLNFLDSNSFEVIISIFQRTEKVPDMERLHCNTTLCHYNFSLLIRNGAARYRNWDCRIDFFNHRIYRTQVK